MNLFQQSNIADIKKNNEFLDRLEGKSTKNDIIREYKIKEQRFIGSLFDNFSYNNERFRTPW